MEVLLPYPIDQQIHLENQNSYRPSIEVEIRLSETKFFISSNAFGIFSDFLYSCLNNAPPGVYRLNNFRTQDINGYYSDFWVTIAVFTKYQLLERK